jgi:hypothetical protein
MKTRDAAINAALNYGIDIRNGNFFRDVSLSQSCFLAELAKEVGYRKPKNANGSTGRYFFEHLKKQFNKTF